MDVFNVAPLQLDELIAKLTPRQMQVVHLLAQGHSRKHIATILSISPETVKTHINKMCRKLDVENKIQVIVIYTIWKARNL